MRDYSGPRLRNYYLGIALLAKGRIDEVFEDYPVGVESLSQFHGRALGEAVGYYWQAYLNDPEWVVARNGLRIPPQDTARLDEAIDHYRQAIRLDPGLSSPRGSRPGAACQTPVRRGGRRHRLLSRTHPAQRSEDTREF